MIKLWCLGLLVFVVSVTDGTHYEHGDVILQVRQRVVRRPSGCGCDVRRSSCACDTCPRKTKVACRHLGGTCISSSKSCNGDTMSGKQYCGGLCRCCVPHTILATVNPNTITAKSVPPHRRRRSSGCEGSYDGLEYTGQCKLDCAATGMVETYDHDCRSTRSIGNTNKCCIKKPLKHCNISGTLYKSGKRFKNNCMMFDCYNGTLTSELKYNKKCAQCKIRNDPHFKTFDKINFDWHGQTDALLAQQGKEECPAHYVGMAFRSCAADDAPKWATCWNTVFYQTPSGIQISAPRIFDNIEPVVRIDGNEQTLNDREISILKGGDGTEVPVIGFKKDECLHILGIEDEGFLVVVCSFHILIFAHPSLKSNMAGLCGSWTEDEGGLEGYYDLRNGTQIVRPALEINKKKYILPPVVGLDWEMPGCLFKSRRRRDTSIPVVSDEEPCNATVSQLATFSDSCSPPILAMGSLDNETKTEMIDNCVFDVCIAISRENNSTLAEAFLGETKKMAVQAESAANDTVEYPPGQPGAPNATDYGTDFADLEWAEPEDAADANITKYLIQRRDLSGGDWVQCGEVIGTLNQTTITDVEEDHEYIFQVIAVSEAGESEPSLPSKSLLFASPYVPTIAPTDSGETTASVTAIAIDSTWPVTPDGQLTTADRD